MGIRLIRENSDTPNVTNMDDARMARYAYGGYNGFVQGKGRELNCEGNGTDTLTINSGVIVLQGWEVEVDSNGWDMKISASNHDLIYYTVYCEVNLSVGAAASIKSTYAESDFPVISAGDDLTKKPNGIARIELCHFTAQNGTISSAERVINAIPYLSVQLDIMSQKLKEQGFRVASAENGELVLYDGWADATIAEGYPKISFTKSGKLVAFQGFRIASRTGFVLDGEYLTIDTVIGKVPKIFAPQQDFTIYSEGSVYLGRNSGDYLVERCTVNLTICSNGEIKIYVRGSNVFDRELNYVKINSTFFSEKIEVFEGLFGEKLIAKLPVWIKNFEEET